jgi:hypothetical protein
MRKLWFNIFITAGLAASVLLAACAQARPTGPAEKPVATEDASAPKMDCQVVSMNPTQGPTEISKFPPVREDDWVHGKNPKAPITIIEYSDFQ